MAAIQSSLCLCADCLYGWNNPLSASSTINVTTSLSACMQCDELHCSAYFLQACGANRRTAGVVSDINRPSQHVCTAARADALTRATRAASNPPPTTMATDSFSSSPAGLRAKPKASELPPPPPLPSQQQGATLLAVQVGLVLAALAVMLRALFGPRTRPLPAGHYDKPRRFVLTGCASGMGRRLTHTLLRRGHTVLATDINAQAS